MSSDNNLPDWLRQLRDQQIGAANQPAPSSQPVPIDMGSQNEPAATPSRSDELDALREIASVEPLPVAEPRQIDLPIINRLTPVQRFVLALMLFLNVTVLGCLFLMVTEKISFVR